MKNGQIIIAAIAGTTAFTLFSYVLSRTLNKKFEEPKLLGEMVDDVGPDLNERQAKFTGWVIHYLVGYAFAYWYFIQESFLSVFKRYA